MVKEKITDITRRNARIEKNILNSNPEALIGGDVNAGKKIIDGIRKKSTPVKRFGSEKLNSVNEDTRKSSVNKSENKLQEIGKIIGSLEDKFSDILLSEVSDDEKKSNLEKLLSNLNEQQFDDSEKAVLKNKIENILASIGNVIIHEKSFDNLVPPKTEKVKKQKKEKKSLSGFDELSSFEFKKDEEIGLENEDKAVASAAKPDNVVLENDKISKQIQSEKYLKNAEKNKKIIDRETYNEIKSYESQSYDALLNDYNNAISHKNLKGEKLIKKLDDIRTKLEKIYKNNFNAQRLVSIITKKIENIQLSEEKIKDEILKEPESIEEEKSGNNEDNISDVTQKEIDFILNSLDEDLNKDQEAQTKEIKPYIINVDSVDVTEADDNGEPPIDVEYTVLENDEDLNNKDKEEIIELTDTVEDNKQKEKNDEDYYAGTEAGMVHIDESDNRKIDNKKEEQLREKDEFEDYDETEAFYKINLEREEVKTKKEILDLINDNKKEQKAEINKTLAEELNRIDELPVAEKKKWYEGIGNIGYWASEKKNVAMASAFSAIGNRFEGKAGVVGKYFNNYANIFHKSADNDRKLREMVGKGKISTSVGFGKGAGVFLKYGKIVYDFMLHGSFKNLNPFRHVTAGAMFLGRSAEALKETRFESKKAMENTRVGKESDFEIYEKVRYIKNADGTNSARTDAEIEAEKNKLDKEDLSKYEKAEKDMGRAMEEAYAIYENVFGEDELKKMKKGEKASNSVLDQARIEQDKSAGKFDEKNLKQYIKTEVIEQFKSEYKKQLPEDLQKRFSRGEIGYTKWWKFCVDNSKGVNSYLHKLNAKLEKIENNPRLSDSKKVQQREELLLRNESFINDLDRMVGDAGAVDTVAYVSRSVERGAKITSSLMMIDSLRLFAMNAWELWNVSETNEQNLDLKSLIEKNLKNKKNNDARNTITARSRTFDSISVNESDKIYMPSPDSADSELRVSDYIPSPEEVNENLTEVTIGGKINTFSEAAYEAAKKSDVKTQDNFIRHYLKDDSVAIDDGNRAELIKRAVRKLSVLNLKTGDGDDVENLVYEGNVGQLNTDGSFKILKGDGLSDARVSSEEQLRMDALKLKVLRDEINGTRGGDAKPDLPNTTFENSSAGSGENIKIEDGKIEVTLDRTGDNTPIRMDEAGREKGLTSSSFNIPQEKSEASSGQEFFTNAGNSETASAMENRNEAIVKEFIETHLKQENLDKIIDNMPISFKENEDLQLNYLKIFAGNDSEKSDGIKSMFKLNYKPEEPVGFTVHENGLLTINDVNGKEGTSILIDTKNNLIGLDSPEKEKAWGVKSTFLGFGKKVPLEKLEPESLKTINELVSEKDMNVIENIEEEDFKEVIQDISE